jgi:NitT/TauT family transport system ATP-binding protein
MEDSILKVQGLKKIYHTNKEEILAIEDISFDLKEGEFVSIVGPSGCGKSTILSILCGLLDKSAGDIKYKNGINLGYMLQDDSLLEFRNILKNCLIGLEIKGELTEENKNYVINLLKTYGLKDFMNSYPENLSGGMRQRVALIRTLATKPDILLLDEPFSALDYQSRLAVSDDVYRILKSEKKSAIMVTHDLAEAISMSDRVIVLTERPSKVKKIYEINLTNKSTPIENRKAKEFSDYYDKIWKDIDFHV